MLIVGVGCANNNVAFIKAKSASSTKKYELTGETKNIRGLGTLRRIRALRSFGDVKEGVLGGWVQSEKNLSHMGNCWIYYNAIVHESALVSHNARVYDNAHICGESYIGGNAVITDNVRIERKSSVKDNVVISGKARIYQRKVSGNKKVGGDTVLDSDNSFRAVTKNTLEDTGKFIWDVFETSVQTALFPVCVVMAFLNGGSI